LRVRGYSRGSISSKRGIHKRGIFDGTHSRGFFSRDFTKDVHSKGSIQAGIYSMGLIRGVLLKEVYLMDSVYSSCSILYS
jgi:hypothetical protein